MGEKSGMKQRHAYLVMAHNHFVQLEKLLKCLDHERTDIYLHIDKKVVFDASSLENCLKKSRVYFANRISVSWGGYSQIQAELELLRAAVKNGPYAYYHLLTGVDLPLKNQEKILSFFDQQHMEFISIGQEVSIREAWFADRLIYVYPFQEYFSRKNVLGKFLRKTGVVFQKMIRINRLRNCQELFGIGSAYFDITDRFARYVLSQYNVIKKRYQYTFCADEIFLQWLWLNWTDKGQRYIATKSDDQLHISQQYRDVLRAIDWNRGKPYTFTMSDCSDLLSSEYFFARKFDDNIDQEVVDAIVDAVCSCEAGDESR